MNYFHILENNKTRREKLLVVINEILGRHPYSLKEGIITGEIEDFIEKTKDFDGENIYFLDPILNEDKENVEIANKVGKIIKNREPKCRIVLIIKNEYLSSAILKNMGYFFYIPITTFSIMESYIEMSLIEYKEYEENESKNDNVIEEIISDTNIIIINKSITDKNRIDLIYDDANTESVISSLNKYISKYDCFLKCSSHTSVNIKKITEYNHVESSVTMLNGEKIYISVRNKTKIKKIMYLNKIPLEGGY